MGAFFLGQNSYLRPSLILIKNNDIYTAISVYIKHINSCRTA